MNCFSDFERFVLNKLEDIIHRLVKLEREQNFALHILRKIAADRNLQPEEIEVDVVSRYIPCYTLDAVRELEGNIQRDEEFKKNLVGSLDMLLLF